MFTWTAFLAACRCSLETFFGNSSFFRRIKLCGDIALLINRCFRLGLYKIADGRWQIWAWQWDDVIRCSGSISPSNQTCWSSNVIKTRCRRARTCSAIGQCATLVGHCVIVTPNLNATPVAAALFHVSSFAMFVCDSVRPGKTMFWAPLHLWAHSCHIVLAIFCDRLRSFSSRRHLHYSLVIVVCRGGWAAWHLPGGPVGPPVRWAATSNVEVGLMKSIVESLYLPLIPRFKIKVLSELQNLQTSHQPSSRFVILLLRDQLTFGNYCYILVTYPVKMGRVAREGKKGARDEVIKRS